MPYQMIYSSQATEPMTAAGLEAILDDARTGNEARGITGALVYVDGVFLQILEGEKDVVVGLMSRIAQDARHGSVKVFHEVEIDTPGFGGWRMAYLSATPDQVSAWAGLPGTATIEALLADLGREPRHAAQMAGNLLRALAA